MREIFAYLTTDDEGFEGVMYAETASGHRIPLLAESRPKAEALRPIVDRLGQFNGQRPITLARFSGREDLDVIEAKKK